MTRMLIVLTALALSGVAGCAGSTKPYEYRDEKNEMAGPGLFSGEEGGFVIYNEPAEHPEKDDRKTQRPPEQ